jgi:transposase
MPQAYSNDLRRRVIGFLEDGVSQSKTAQTFSISIITVKRWWKSYKTTKSYEPRQRVFDLSKLRTINYDRVAAYVDKHPDETLKDLGKRFKTSDTAILYILRKLNITYKKTLPLRGAKGRFERRI